MQISLVSCAGPDDGNDPVETARRAAGLADAYPAIRAEFALQLSLKRQGTREYPSQGWIDGYLQTILRDDLPARTALHINGAWSRSFAGGMRPHYVATLMAARRASGSLVFDRVQLNFAAKKDNIKAGPLAAVILAHPQHRFVLQHNATNTALIAELLAANVPFDVLFDASLGLGVTPDAWVSPVAGRFCAYSGGLSPSNLETHLPQIALAVGSDAIGIDAQSGLRSADKALFIAAKARDFIAAATDWNTRTKRVH
jgi:hypothetical protein